MHKVTSPAGGAAMPVWRVRFRLGLVAGAAGGLFLAGCAGGGAPAVEPTAAPVAAVAAAAAAAPAPTSAALATPAVDAAELTVQDLVPLLSRTGVGPGQVGITLIYAPPLFFEVTRLTIPPESTTRPTLIFILQEDIHEGDLGDAGPPTVVLRLGSGQEVAPYAAVVTAEDPHHRTSRLLFPAPTEVSAGGEGAGSITLFVLLEDGSVSVANTFVWNLPILAGATQNGTG